MPNLTTTIKKVCRPALDVENYIKSLGGCHGTISEIYNGNFQKFLNNKLGISISEDLSVKDFIKSLTNDQQDTEITLLDILNSFGVEDAYWLMVRCWDYKEYCQLSANVAETVPYIKDVDRPKLSVESIRDYYSGKITEEMFKKAAADILAIRNAAYARDTENTNTYYKAITSKNIQNIKDYYSGKITDEEYEETVNKLKADASINFKGYNEAVADSQGSELYYHYTCVFENAYNMDGSFNTNSNIYYASAEANTYIAMKDGKGYLEVKDEIFSKQAKINEKLMREFINSLQ
jgi:hypothetical protein